MKLTRTEKIWLIAVIVLYGCYNLPFFPAYGAAGATLIHAAVTLIPLWIVIYVGFFKVCKIYKIKDSKSAGQVKEQPADRTKEKKSC